MKNIFWIVITIIFTLNAQVLFEVKDASDLTVLEVSTDGLRIFNEGDTLMVISSTEIKAFIDANAKDRGLSRSFSVSTNTTGKNDEGKMFRIAASDGAKFFNPDDNSDEILSINKGSITANVNPTLDRDFVVNDQATGKAGGNLMKISNKDAFVAVDDSTMLWYKQKNAFRVGHVKINSDSEVGQASFASGRRTIASGDYSTAMGYFTNATGLRSTVMGSGSIASGDYSTAMGDNAETIGSRSTAMGGYSTASGDYSTAMGGHTTASGNYSTAMGYSSTASGLSSTAMGGFPTASGEVSTALGYLVNATGDYSTALGRSTEASGDYSTALGRSTEAQSYLSVTMGQFNNIEGTPGSWVDTDPAFVIGNGTGPVSRSNAFEVKKDGTVYIPSLFTNYATTLWKTTVYVDIDGKLCVNSKEQGYTDEDVVNLIIENKQLTEKVSDLESRILKLEKLLDK